MIANVAGQTPDQVFEVLANTPHSERPHALTISPDDAPAWDDYLPQDLRLPRRHGAEPWVYSAYGMTLPIRVHVSAASTQTTADIRPQTARGTHAATHIAPHPQTAVLAHPRKEYRV